MEKLILPFEDGTGPIIDEMAKEKEELEKETEKDLSAKVKMVDEINKAKPMKEKLTLPEVDDFILNESEEAELDEAVPKDLVEPFKKAKPTKRNTNDSTGYKYFSSNDRKKYYQPVDFQNSEYIEITPEEANKLRKEHPEQVMALFDGQLVTFDEQGKQLYRAERNWQSNRDLYKRPSGADNDKSNNLTQSAIIPRAEKLYKVVEVPKDPDLVNRRAANPESGRNDSTSLTHRNAYTNMLDRARSNYRYGDQEYKDLSNKINNQSELRGYYKRMPDQYYKRQYERYMKLAKEAKSNAKNATTEDERARYLARAKQCMEYAADYRKRVVADMQANKDYNARVRYKASEDSLQSKLKQFATLKANVYGLEKQTKEADKKLSDVKSQGSPATVKNREKLAEYKNRLREIQKEIDRYEMYLEGSEEDDQEAINTAQKALDDIMAQYREAHKDIANLLGRQTESVEDDFILPLDEDIETLNKVKDAGKVDELNGLIKDLYPEGVTVDQVKDILNYEGDYVLNTLGIKGEK